MNIKAYFMAVTLPHLSRRTFNNFNDRERNAKSSTTAVPNMLTEPKDDYHAKTRALQDKGMELLYVALSNANMALDSYIVDLEEAKDVLLHDGFLPQDQGMSLGEITRRNNYVKRLEYMKAAAKSQKCLVKWFEKKFRHVWSNLKDLERVNDGSAKESGAATKREGIGA